MDAADDADCFVAAACCSVSESLAEGALLRGCGCAREFLWTEEPPGRSSSLSDKVRSTRLLLFLDEEDCNINKDDAACCVSLVLFAPAMNESSSH